jgi:stage V sporulation protein G
MEITEVRIKLAAEDPETNDRIRAFASITLDDCFRVHDLKIVETFKGLIVAMPNRKVSDHCGACGTKNHLRARHCGQCGARLDPHRAVPAKNGGPPKLFEDTAHPLDREFRARIEAAVLGAYLAELGIRPRAEVA